MEPGSLLFLEDNSIKTCYENHDGEFLAIVKALKTRKYYLKGCKHELLVLIDYNNL